VVDEYQEKALSRAREASQAIAVLALQLDRIAADLESALTDLRASTRAKEPGAPQSQPTEPSGVDASAVGQLERRSGVGRRASQERRQTELSGLAARILGATNRRGGGDRRSGAGRRIEDQQPIAG
jgi:hypothetical protein